MPVNILSFRFSTISTTHAVQSNFRLSCAVVTVKILLQLSRRNDIEFEKSSARINKLLLLRCETASDGPSLIYLGLLHVGGDDFVCISSFDMISQCVCFNSATFASYCFLFYKCVMYGILTFVYVLYMYAYCIYICFV